MCEVLAHLKSSKSWVRSWSKPHRNQQEPFDRFSIPWRIVQQRRDCKFQLQRVANHRASKFGKPLNVPPCSNYFSASFCAGGRYQPPEVVFANTFSLRDFPGDRQECESSSAGVGVVCWWMQIPAEQEDSCTDSQRLEGAVSPYRCGGMRKGGVKIPLRGFRSEEWKTPPWTSQSFQESSRGGDSSSEPSLCAEGNGICQSLDAEGCRQDQRKRVDAGKLPYITVLMLL